MTDDFSGMKDLLLVQSSNGSVPEILTRCGFTPQDDACVAVCRASETTVWGDDPMRTW